MLWFRIESGSRRAKMTQKKIQLINFIFWSAGCSLLRAEGLSCSLNVQYEGIRISKLQFSIKKSFGHQNPGSGLWTGSGIETRSVFTWNAGSGSVPGSTTLDERSFYYVSKQEWVMEPIVLISYERFRYIVAWRGKLEFNRYVKSTAKNHNDHIIHVFESSKSTSLSYE